MSMDFLGTFNSAQFDRLVAFARDRIAFIDARIRHLNIERQRVGFLRFSYDESGRPVAYSTGQVGGEPTYIGKLMGAYEVMGGDPFFDLQVRTLAQAVYLPKGTEQAPTQILSNGEPLPNPGLSDGPSGDAVRAIRSWFAGDLGRLEKLERKIRRMVDYSDQLQEEINQLGLARSGVDVDGSLENLVEFVQQLLNDPTYRAIAPDNGRDPFGKFTYAPFSSYEPGGDRSASPGVSIQRTESGYVVVGDSE